MCEHARGGLSKLIDSIQQVCVVFSEEESNQ